MKVSDFKIITDTNVPLDEVWACRPQPELRAERTADGLHVVLSYRRLATLKVGNEPEVP